MSLRGDSATPDCIVSSDDCHSGDGAGRSTRNDANLLFESRNRRDGNLEAGSRFAILFVGCSRNIRPRRSEIEKRCRNGLPRDLPS